MSYIGWFGELSTEGNLTLIAGGKGASLCKMFQAGMPVPDGFNCCAEMFDAFMEANGLWDTVYELTDNVIWDEGAEQTRTLSAAGAKLREMVAAAPMPADMEQMLVDNYLKLGDNVPVAVRSSGTAEDLEDASFAGQQETFLYVIGKEEVVKFVKECWASLYNDNAIYYRHKNNFAERDISIAVVVMKMVNSEKSGVMFSVNPINKAADEVLMEAAWGLGEAVVQGIVNPDNYVVNKNDYSFKMKYVASKDIMVIRASERGGSKEVPVPENIKNDPVLTDDEVRQLVDLAIKAEQYYGKPQDLEWAFEDGRMYLLQSRPITTL
ncbi:MAG: hypothetical protein KBS83_06570 [Lachnospiraceae bacterium]|nr:hypothetical protein [Candidatus Equihabitans merdae]